MPTEELSWEVTGPRDTELNLVRDSWRRGMQFASNYARMPTRAYVGWATEVINAFIGRDVHRIELAGDDFMLVARDRQRPVYVLGWLIATDTKPGVALHWVYTKSHHWRQGVASDLIVTAIERCEPGEVTYGVHSQYDHIWNEWGFEFKPIQIFESSRRERSAV